MSLEALRFIDFPAPIYKLVFSKHNELYAGVDEHGVVSCNTSTGELGEFITSTYEGITGLALGMLCSKLLAFFRLILPIDVCSA